MRYSEEFLNNIKIIALDVETATSHELDNERKDELLTLVVLTDPAEWSSLSLPEWMYGKTFAVTYVDPLVMQRLQNILALWDTCILTTADDFNLNAACLRSDPTLCTFCPVSACNDTHVCTVRDTIQGAARLFDHLKPDARDTYEQIGKNISDRLTGAVALITLLHTED